MGRSSPLSPLTRLYNRDLTSPGCQTSVGCSRLPVSPIPCPVCIVQSYSLLTRHSSFPPTSPTPSKPSSSNLCCKSTSWTLTISSSYFCNGAVSLGGWPLVGGQECGRKRGTKINSWGYSLPKHIGPWNFHNHTTGMGHYWASSTFQSWGCCSSEKPMSCQIEQHQQPLVPQMSPTQIAR